MPEGKFKDINREIKKMIAEIAEVPEEKITEDVNLADDLGVDSMMALEIVAAIEKKYRVKISEEKIPTIRSFRNVVELLEELV